MNLKTGRIWEFIKKPIVPIIGHEFKDAIIALGRVGGSLDFSITASEI